MRLRCRFAFGSICLFVFPSSRFLRVSATRDIADFAPVIFFHVVNRRGRIPARDVAKRHARARLSTTGEHLITSVRRSRLNSGYEVANPFPKAIRAASLVARSSGGKANARTPSPRLAAPLRSRPRSSAFRFRQTPYKRTSVRACTYHYHGLPHTRGGCGDDPPFGLRRASGRARARAYSSKPTDCDVGSRH